MTRGKSLRLCSRRAAFTIVELVVALAVILILAAVALPNIAGYLRQTAAEETANRLAIVRDALYNPAAGANAFYQKVGKNAGRLSELSSTIIADDASYATGSDDSCGGVFKKGNVNNWQANGPFVNFHIDRMTGLVVPIGRAEDTLTRIPNSADPGVLRLNFLDNVALSDADLLDQIVDAGDGNTAGVVQWTLPAVGGLVTLYYIVPINNQC